MSDTGWQLEADYQPNTAASKPKAKPGEWAVEEEQPSDVIARANPDESMLGAIAKAGPRMGQDMARNVWDAAHAVPGLYEKSKTEYPGFLNNVYMHPGSMAKQGMAGLVEAGIKTANTPFDIANYMGPGGLNLLPENVNNKIQEHRIPDYTKQINEIYGEPKYTGEEGLRGVMRNIIPIAGLGATAKALNPLKLADMHPDRIVNKVLNEGARQETIGNNWYNRIWDRASNLGYNRVTTTPAIINNNLQFLRQFYGQEKIGSLERFAHNQTLPNAQRAQSDLGAIAESYRKINRTRALTDVEGQIRDAADQAQQHIRDNMFRDRQGNIHQGLRHEYNAATANWQANVVPYKYNANIQKYLNPGQPHRGLLNHQLATALKSDAFAAAKGGAHPELFRADNLVKALKAIGYGAGGMGLLGGGAAGLDYLTNRAPSGASGGE
jgi:hypothetical protein